MEIREDAGLKFVDDELKSAYNKHMNNLKEQAKNSANQANQ